MPNMDLYTALIAGLVGGSGGGGGGTSNYNSLSNKPQINGNALTGNKTAAQLGLQTPITFDDEPTSGSSHVVRSGGVYDALSAKQDELTFDSEPTVGSTNPVTSNGIAEALQNVQIDIATEQDAGIVKPDGTSVTIDNDGTIHAVAGVNFDERDFVEDNGTVSLVDSQRIFTGTQAEWDALTTDEKF